MGSANVMIREVHQVPQVPPIHHDQERGGVMKRQKILNGAQTDERKELWRLKFPLVASSMPPPY